MNLRNNVVTRAGATAALAAVVTTTASVVAATPVSAATIGGVVRVCSYGNYTSYVKFPTRGTVTWPVSSGSCGDTKVGFGQTIERIEVWGYLNGREFKLIDGQLRPACGGAAQTHGNRQQDRVAWVTPVSIFPCKVPHSS